MLSALESLRQQAQMHLKPIMCLISITKVTRVSVLRSVSTASQEYTRVTSQEVGRDIYLPISHCGPPEVMKRERETFNVQNNKIIQFNWIRSTLIQLRNSY